MTSKMIAVNPHDDVYRYTAQVYPSILLFGPYRHYRTVKHSTYTCLASRAIFDKYRNHFDDAAEWILRKDENDTINQVWNKDDVMMFSPIPSLSLHITLESLKDPYIDFEELWNSIPQLWKRGDPSKFAVVSMYDESHSELAAYTWPNKEAYANKHGYKSYVKTSGWNIKPIHFEKLTHMLDVMKLDTNLEWVWWLDNDAIVTNFDIKLEDIVDDDCHVIITSDIACLNAGSFIVRNSEKGREWLEFILVKGLEHYKDNRWPEQQPMSDFFISFHEIIKIVPQRTMNSYNYNIYRVDPTDLIGTNGQWEQGDFVLHMPAIPNAMRIDMVKQLTQMIDNNTN